VQKECKKVGGECTDSNRDLHDPNMNSCQLDDTRESHGWLWVLGREKSPLPARGQGQASLSRQEHPLISLVEAGRSSFWPLNGTRVLPNGLITNGDPKMSIPPGLSSSWQEPALGSRGPWFDSTQP
jgi:hypothetical protein